MAAVALGVLVALLAGGCGRQAETRNVNVQGLQDEVALVTHEHLLAEGFDYEPKVTCTASDPLTFTCAITMETPSHETLTDVVSVTCLADSDLRGGQRCTSSKGDALQ